MDPADAPVSRHLTALIPVAGRGTRMRPVTPAVPKALFPLVDAGQRVRTVLGLILAEAASAGACRAGVIVSPNQKAMIRTYLETARAESDPAPAPEVELIVQPEPRGFGDAVLRGAPLVGNEPFLLLLGDHVRLPEAGRPSCAAQVTAAFARHECAAMVGMQTVGPEELAHVGVAAGAPLGDRLYRCRDFAEKPDPAAARDKLVTPGLGEDRFLAHAGVYAFGPEMMGILAGMLEGRSPTQTGELELADAQAKLLRRHPEDYLLCHVAGQVLDVGTPAGYARAVSVLLNGRG